MAWTTPRTWVSGELVTAALMNTYIKENQDFLKTEVDANKAFVGARDLTDGGILLGSGTSAITALGVATNGQIPIGDGSGDPVLATISGTSNQVDVTNGAGSITVSYTHLTLPTILLV